MQALNPFNGLQLHLFGVLTAGPHRVDALGKKFTASPAAINTALRGLANAGLVDLQTREGRLWASLRPGAQAPADLDKTSIPASILKTN